MMPIIQTNKWLENYISESEHVHPRQYPNVQLDAIIRPLAPFFDEKIPLEEIHFHLARQGLFRPDRNSQQMVHDFLQSKLWQTTEAEYKKLKQEWSGHEVPIILLPSDTENPVLKRSFNGKAGLSYEDKVFLFIPPQLAPMEQKALLTHEYHHACRLNRLKQEEDDLTLLDSIVMEGLAEYAVEERLGKTHRALWTTLYSQQMATRWWRAFLMPNLEVSKQSPKHQALLYGGGRYPKWVGYNVGYHLVKSFVENEQATTTEMLGMATTDIYNHSSFASDI